MSEEVMSEKELDQIEVEATKEVKTVDEIKEESVIDEREPIVNDKSAEDEVNLGDLGTFKKASEEDMSDVFAKLPETLFQLKTCLFKVTYINEGTGRFTAELMNK